MSSGDEQGIWMLGSLVCTERQWTAIVLVYGQELSHRRAGALMGIGERSTSRLVDRGLRRIRHHLERVEAHGQVAA
jgi:DNA-directed RNA polymerase specialized sigma subunit